MKQIGMVQGFYVNDHQTTFLGIKKDAAGTEITWCCNLYVLREYFDPLPTLPPEASRFTRNSPLLRCPSLAGPGYNMDSVTNATLLAGRGNLLYNRFAASRKDSEIRNPSKPLLFTDGKDDLKASVLQPAGTAGGSATDIANKAFELVTRTLHGGNGFNALFLDAHAERLNISQFTTADQVKELVIVGNPWEYGR